MGIIIENSPETNQLIIGKKNNDKILFGSNTPVLRGPRGYSNYELALQNGFEGTEEEYLKSLKGEPGTNDYNEQINKPSIEGVELINDKTFEELGALSLTNMEIEELINKIVL